jgi:hypothetical protein
VVLVTCHNLGPEFGTKEPHQLASLLVYNER